MKIQCFSFEEKYRLYADKSTRLGGNPFEEARAPFKRAGIFHVNSPARLTGGFFSLRNNFTYNPASTTRLKTSPFGI